MGTINYTNFTSADYQKIQAGRKDPKPQWKIIVHKDGQTFEDVKSSKPISDEFEAWLIVLTDDVKNMIVDAIDSISSDTDAWLKKNATQIKNNIQFNKQKELEEVERSSLLTEYDDLYSSLTPIENDRIAEVDDLFRYLMYSQEQKQEKRRNVRWQLDTFNLDSERLKNLRGTREQHNAQIKTWSLVIKEYINKRTEKGSGLFSKLSEYVNNGADGNLLSDVSNLFKDVNLADAGAMAGYLIGGPAGSLIGGKVGTLLGGKESSSLGIGLNAVFGDPTALTDVISKNSFGNVIGDSIISGGIGGMLNTNGIPGLSEGFLTKETLSNIGQITNIAGSLVPNEIGSGLKASGTLLQGGSLLDSINSSINGFTENGFTGAITMLNNNSKGWNGTTGSLITGFGGATGVGDIINNTVNPSGINNLIANGISGESGGGGTKSPLSDVFGSGGANAFSSLLSSKNYAGGALKGKSSNGVNIIMGKLVNPSPSTFGSSFSKSLNVSNLSGNIVTSAFGGALGNVVGKTVGGMVSDLLNPNVSKNYNGFNIVGDLLRGTSGAISGPLGKAMNSSGKLLQGKTITDNELLGISSMKNTPVGKLTSTLLGRGTVSGDGGFAGLGNGVTPTILGGAVGKFLAGNKGDKLGKTIAQSLDNQQVGSAVFNNFGSQIHQLVPKDARKYVNRSVLKAGLTADGDKLVNASGKIATNLKSTYIKEAVNTVSNTTNAAVNKGVSSLTQQQVNDIPKASVINKNEVSGNINNLLTSL